MKLSIEELPEGYEARYAAAGDIIGEAKAAASAIQDEAAYNLNAAYGPR